MVFDDISEMEEGSVSKKDQQPLSFSRKSTSSRVAGRSNSVASFVQKAPYFAHAGVLGATVTTTENTDSFDDAPSFFAAFNDLLHIRGEILIPSDRHAFVAKLQHLLAQDNLLQEPHIMKEMADFVHMHFSWKVFLRPACELATDTLRFWYVARQAFLTGLNTIDTEFWERHRGDPSDEMKQNSFELFHSNVARVVSKRCAGQFPPTDSLNSAFMSVAAMDEDTKANIAIFREGQLSYSSDFPRFTTKQEGFPLFERAYWTTKEIMAIFDCEKKAFACNCKGSLFPLLNADASAWSVKDLVATAVQNGIVILRKLASNCSIPQLDDNEDATTSLLTIAAAEPTKEDYASTIEALKIQIEQLQAQLAQSIGVN